MADIQDCPRHKHRSLEALAGNPNLDHAKMAALICRMLMFRDMEVSYSGLERWMAPDDPITDIASEMGDRLQATMWETKGLLKKVIECHKGKLQTYR